MGLVLVVLVGGGCAGRSDDPVQSDSVGDDTALSCTYSSDLDVAPDGGLTPGCHVTPDAKVCEVSNGATVSPSGVSNGTETCKSVCPKGQYPVTCLSGNVMGPIPDLPSGLSCQVSGLPTAGDDLTYCCPCGD